MGLSGTAVRRSAAVRSVGTRDEGDSGNEPEPERVLLVVAGARGGSALGETSGVTGSTLNSEANRPPS